ncbi:MAG: DUF4097 family beta strand repeat protein [Oscillospiraceae bacterium]|nr:DUF4097 family beta strand repeat protein [Oscillospiraceae bacterium]
MKTAVLIAVSAALIITGSALCAFSFTVLGYDPTVSVGPSGKAETHSSVYEIQGSFNKIDINVQTDNIVFEASADKTCRIECFEYDYMHHEAEIRNGVLEIKQIIDEHSWSEHIGMNLSSPSMTVYLPGSSFDQLKIVSNSGDTDIPEGLSFANTDIKLNTGDLAFGASVSDTLSASSGTGSMDVWGSKARSITLSSNTGTVGVKDLTADTISLSSNTGGLYMSNCTSDTVTLTSGTDSIQLDSVTCSDISAVSDTGDIEFSTVIASGRMSAEANTGDISYDECDAGEIYSKTNTGDITGTLLSGKEFIVRSDTGDKSVPSSSHGGRCELITNTGDISIDIITLGIDGEFDISESTE